MQSDQFATVPSDIPDINAAKTEVQTPIIAAIPFTKARLRKYNKSKTLYLSKKPFDRLNPYPSPLYFINHRTKKTVLAYKWGENRVRIFLLRNRYSKKLKGMPNYSITGIGSRIISKKEFNVRYSFSPVVDLSDRQIAIISKKKKCTVCEKSKFLVEFHHNTRQRNCWSDRCICCIAASREASMNFDREGDCSSLDRSIRDNFIKYMKANPYYFKDVFECEATDQNINQSYENVINNVRNFIKDNSISKFYKEEISYGL